MGYDASALWVGRGVSPTERGDAHAPAGGGGGVPLVDGRVRSGETPFPDRSDLVGDIEAKEISLPPHYFFRCHQKELSSRNRTSSGRHPFSGRRRPSSGRRRPSSPSSGRRHPSSGRRHPSSGRRRPPSGHHQPSGISFDRGPGSAQEESRGR